MNKHIKLILMMPFSTGIGLERVGVVGLDLDRWRAGLQALDVACLYKNENGGGRRGLRPWLLRCLSQFLSKRKERLLREFSVSECVPFTTRVAMYL